MNATETVELELGGSTYGTRKLEGEEWKDLQAMIRRAVPGPIERAASAADAAERRGEPFRHEARKEFFGQAIDAAAHWPPAPGGTEWFQAIEAAEGGDESFVWEALRRDNPGLAREDVAGLIARMAPGEMVRLIARAVFGVEPEADPILPGQSEG